MAINPLPPQAYTKETLQKAYAWLLTQGSSVKELAADQNTLVSLYLKAQRNGDAALDAPSIQNFKQELKTLAGMMGDLQSNKQTPYATPQASFTPPQASYTPAPSFTPPQQTQQEAQQRSTLASQAQPQPPATHIAISSASHAHAHAVTQETVTLSTTTTSTSVLAGLDEVSLQTLQEVRETLNLSSDVEALRALIALGFKQFKKIY